MERLAERLYVPRLYKVMPSRQAVIDVLTDGIVESGGRVLFCSFPEELVAPMYIGAEDTSGNRYGMLIYPFTTTNRPTKNRSAGERRGQIRFGDPKRVREHSNIIGQDVAGVDVTLILTVDPEEKFIIGLDPRVYEDLPMGISVYYYDEHVESAEEHGWYAWENEKRKGSRREAVVELETLVGFHPTRLLDYARFEAQASSLGLTPGLRLDLAERFQDSSSGTHDLESFFDLDSDAILDIIKSNFRLGIAVRGGVAEHHLDRQLRTSELIASVEAIDEDGAPDFEVDVGGETLTIECKTASAKPYANGDYKVEVQKTRDSKAGRQYKFDQFDILAACLFSATGIWEFRFKLTQDLLAGGKDPSRIKPQQAIDDSWSKTIDGLLGD